MNRLLKVVIALVFSVVTVTGCSSASEINTAEVAKKMVEDTTLSTELVEMNDKNTEFLYTKFDEKLIEEYSVYSCASKASAEEIALFKAKDSASVDSVKAIVETRIEDMKNEYRDYKPGEMSKLNNACIVTKGNYIGLIIADDTSPAEDAFNKAFK